MTKGVKALKDFRHKKSYTQSEFADLAGINRNTVACIEAGINQPSVKTAKLISVFTGIAWNLFFEEL